MNNLDYYMSHNYRMEIIPDEDGEGFVVRFPELKGCISCGATVEEAILNANDARRVWTEACIMDNIEIPEPESKDYSGQFKLRIPKSLHKTLAEHAADEGVSMNMYCTSILARYA